MSETTIDSGALAEPEGKDGVVHDFSRDKQVFGMPWGKAMMWIFLLSDTFIFSCFLVSYMKVRISTTDPWPNPSEVFGLTVFGVSVPLLLLVNNLPWFGGASTWLDTYHVQIIPFIADAFSIFLFYQFFIGLPKDLEEAALVDGASRLRIFWNIVLPLSRPVFATVAILQFLTHWGDFLWPLMVTRGEEVRPLTIGMQAFFGQDPRLWGDLMAFASMITVPVLIVFLLFQKWFVQSVATSGIKGGG